MKHLLLQTVVLWAIAKAMICLWVILMLLSAMDLRGNIALKTIEGTAKYLIGRLRNAANESKRYLLGAGLLKPAVKDIAKDLSGDAHGGAILLGLKAPVLIGHGATSATAVYEWHTRYCRCRS